MNILYLSERNPIDVHFGGAQRTHFIWESLKKNGKVYSVYFTEGPSSQDDKNHIYGIHKNEISNIIRRVEHKVVISLQLIPLTLMKADYDGIFDDLLSKVKFDIIVARYCFDYARFHLWKLSLPVIVDFDDHPMQVYDTLGNYKVRPCLRGVARMILKHQLKYVQRKIDLGLLSNPNQTSLLKTKQASRALPNIAVNPSKQYMEKKMNRSQKIFTVGTMYYPPNYKGVEIFLSEIWPKFHEVFPDISYEIIGRGLPEEYVMKWSKLDGVVYRGFLDDIESEYEACLATVVPIYAGGGTAIKTLESLAFSRICLCSPFGARGLVDYSNKIGAHIFHSADEFIMLFKHHVLNNALRESEEKRAKQYINDNYSLSSFETIISNSINSVLYEYSSLNR